MFYQVITDFVTIVAVWGIGISFTILVVTLVNYGE